MRQRQALTVLLSGENVFLTGAPGAGKTYTLNEFIKRAERLGKRVAVTASTGIAATHIGGTTLHSWSGLGIRETLSERDKAKLAQTDKLVKRYNATDILVVDEVSMLHGHRLDMVNEVAKLLRGNDKPFGGMQVVLVGDLFQLPPVTRGSDALDFAHGSHTWQELDLRICYLTEQHRQQRSDDLLALLQAMRAGTLSAVHTELVKKRLGKQPGPTAVVTQLYSHNVDVDSINERKLAALLAPQHSYHMRTKGRKAAVEMLAKSLLAPETLQLKEGAEVMFVANDFTKGFVNGSRGKVVRFSDAQLPVVKLHNGRVVLVEPHTWSIMEDGKVRAEAVQLPLRLAWAITIHKSQGMSLDSAIVDLSKSFTPGMGYVALSRVRSLDGLFLSGINAMALTLHPDIHAFDKTLCEQSARLAVGTVDAPDEAASTDAPLGRLPRQDEAIFQNLRAWRLRRAQTDKVAPFIVAHDAHLKALATYKPATLQQLLAVQGFGKSKVEKYGADILEILDSKH